MARYFSESEALDNAAISYIYSLAEDDATRAMLRRLGFIVNPYEDKVGYPLTFAERKINLTSIENTLDVIQEATDKEVAIVVEQRKALILKKITPLIENMKAEEIAALSVASNGELAKIYGRVSKELFEVGKKTAADELGVKVATTDPDVRGIYRAQAIQAENVIESGLVETAKTEALDQIRKGADASTTLANVTQAITQKADKMLAATTTQVISGSFSTGRLSTYQSNPDKIYGYQFTAVLDGRTTNLCRSLNGRVVGPKDPDYYYFNPPLHYRCRSFWVAIKSDEFIKPLIEEIPQEIPRNVTGYTRFMDLQKVIEYKPVAAPTTAETRDQRNGVIQNIVDELRKAGAKLR